MNYNARRFTKEEFLSLPIYPHNSKEIPANTDFLLGELFEEQNVIMGSMALQQEALMSILEKITEANTKQREEIDRDSTVNVRYWRKQKDGNISERGGYISMAEILDSMTPPPQAEYINEVPKANVEVVTFEVPDYNMQVEK